MKRAVINAAAAARVDSYCRPHSGHWANCTRCDALVQLLEHQGGDGAGMTTSDAQAVALAEHMRAEALAVAS